MATNATDLMCATEATEYALIQTPELLIVRMRLRLACVTIATNFHAALFPGGLLLTP